MFRVLKWAIPLIVWPFLALAQLQISHPMPRLVVQRGTDNNGRLYVSGRLTSAVDRVEAQLTPVAAGQGNATSWQTVQTNPTNGVFLGAITGAGGWYVLTVRALVGNNVVGQATVQPVGIGEVFITAGQSNSRGLGIGDNDLGTATDRVNAIDSINHGYPPGAQALVSSGDPMPVPVYKPLTAGRRIFPMAESSWGWGELGDYIVSRYNVPVAFYVAGWDASTVENWINSANGIPACNRYFCVANWPNLQPYTNLKNVLHYYASVGGARAVLWHQGEAEFGDAQSGSIPEYANRLRALISKARQDFGGRSIPWVVARASFDGNVSRPDLITKQQEVINTPNFGVFQGPFNDPIVNRNAGGIDVHFRNATRPSPHPRYDLNPASIPTDMGLSLFARNWNNSLDNNFFGNAQPITPEQFAVTNPVADYVRPGSSLQVAFTTMGTFGAGNQWEVQLLDSLGQYRGRLGSGPSSPITVTLPDSLRKGRFQVRVMASSPAMPAVPSNLFRVIDQPYSADLRLTMRLDRRAPALNEPVTVTLFVHNDGPTPATNVVVQNRLPANLAVLTTNGLTLNNNTLTGTVSAINAGAVATLNFTARPTAAGTYRNAAELVQATANDSDSQPNSGTGDGQDDAAFVDFRTREPGNAVYVSPNPDQVPLPPVASNQPTPDANKADVSLSLAVSNRTPRLNDTVRYAITLTNAGGLTATGLGVSVMLPAGQTFVPGDDFAPSGDRLAGGISSLPAGQSVTLYARAKATGSGRSVCTAELATASQPDPDSTTGNGTANGEDDTASVEVRVR